MVPIWNFQTSAWKDCWIRGSQLILPVLKVRATISGASTRNVIEPFNRKASIERKADWEFRFESLSIFDLNQSFESSDSRTFLQMLAVRFLQIPLIRLDCLLTKTAEIQKHQIARNYRNYRPKLPKAWSFSEPLIYIFPPRSFSDPEILDKLPVLVKSVPELRPQTPI